MLEVTRPSGRTTWAHAVGACRGATRATAVNARGLREGVDLAELLDWCRAEDEVLDAYLGVEQLGAAVVALGPRLLPLLLRCLLLGLHRVDAQRLSLGQRIARVHEPEPQKDTGLLNGVVNVAAEPAADAEP